VQERTPQYASQCAAITAVAPKLGCTKETLRRWVREAKRDAGLRPGPTRADEDRIKALERENRELKRANEILRKASACFAAAELDRYTRDDDFRQRGFLRGVPPR
jgi:transposase-like protein